MDIRVLATGIILGVAIAAPVGPIGLLCIRRTLEHGPLMGFVTGLGAAFADAFYGGVAAFGVQVLIDWLTGHEMALRVFGGLFMLAIAIKGLTARRIATADAPDSRSMLGGFLTSLLLTLTNPLTIFGFMAIFAGAGLGGVIGETGAATLVVGVFLGSALWWLTLSSGVAVVRHKISDRLFLTINHTAALLLGVFGIYALVSVALRMSGLAAG